MKESNVWYDQAADPLKADEIEGRILVVETADGNYPSYSSIKNKNEYVMRLIVTQATRYILIPLPEEQPLEFCGIKVHVVQNTPNSFQWAFATKEDCERAWNEFIRRLK